MHLKEHTFQIALRPSAVATFCRNRPLVCLFVCLIACLFAEHNCHGANLLISIILANTSKLRLELHKPRLVFADATSSHEFFPFLADMSSYASFSLKLCINNSTVRRQALCGTQTSDAAQAAAFRKQTAAYLCGVCCVVATAALSENSAQPSILTSC